MSSETADHLAARLMRTPTPLALVQEQAARRPDHPAFVFAQSPDDPSPQVMTYAALADAAERTAGLLIAGGRRPSDSVALLVPATPGGAAALIAATSVGVAFPLNLLLTADGMAAQLRLARARTVLVWGGLEAADRLAAIAAEVPTLEGIIDLTQPPPPAPRQDFVGDPARAAALFHTGGTTGEPKLAELSARGMVAAALMGAAALRFAETDRICVALPLFHVGGAISCMLGAVAAGATVIWPGLLGGRDPALRTGIWRLLSRTRATVLGMVPTSLAGIVDTPLDGVDLRALRGVVTGAAPLPLDIARKLEARLEVPVCQMYGMTELSGVCSAQPLDGLFRRPSVGFPAPLIEVRLEDAAPEPGAAGELRLRGPNSFLGYRTPSGLTDQPLDGWIPTGDHGRIEPDGQLALTGRSKDVIIRGGHNIDPLMIEDAAQRHLAVRVCAAVPMPDAYAGELPVLFVALHPGADAAEDEIGAFVAGQIPDPPARPKRVFILPDLPLTPVGKIARYRLRQAAAIQALREAAGDPSGLNLSCDDPTAKTLIVQWRREAPDAPRPRLVEVARQLGLTISQIE